MKTIDSIAYNHHKKHYSIQLGEIIFFDSFVIVEVNEGLNIDFKDLKEFSVLTREHFGLDNFGLISNRINSYSIVLSDAKLFDDFFSNISVFATVSYSSIAKQVFKIENHFFNNSRKQFSSLDGAVNWVKANLALEI